MKGYRVVTVLCVALLALPHNAGAEPSKRHDPAAAEALFNEARALLQAGKIDRACAKFAESYALDEALGALLNLASCHEKQGKTASAWTEYKEASGMAARQDDPKRKKLADERARALEQNLAYLGIVVRDDSEGLVVTRRGVVLGEASFGTPLPTDPGAIEITAEAPGKQPFRTTVNVGPGERMEVSVPRLRPAKSGAVAAVDARHDDPKDEPRDEPDEPSATPSPRPEASDASGYVLLTTGLVALAAGGVFVGLTAKETPTIDEHCPDKRCDEEGFAAVDRASAYAWGANLGVGAGVLLTALGGYLLFSAPDEPTSASLSPYIGADRVGVTGSF